MNPLLDHDDFQKSRKALMITACTLLILSSIHIVGDSISVWGINIRFERDSFIALGGLGLIYFTYVFILRGMEHAVTQRIYEEGVRLKNLKEYFLEDEQNDLFRRSYKYERAERRIRYYEVVQSMAKLLVLVSIDLVIPVIFSAWVLSHVSASEKIENFIRRSSSANLVGLQIDYAPSFQFKQNAFSQPDDPI